MESEHSYATSTERSEQCDQGEARRAPITTTSPFETKSVSRSLKCATIYLNQSILNYEGKEGKNTCSVCLATGSDT